MCSVIRHTPTSIYSVFRSGMRSASSVLPSAAAILALCLLSLLEPTDSRGLRRDLFTFLPHVYSPCGVSGNFSAVGAQGALSAYVGNGSLAQPPSLEGTVTVYDDCYVAITDLQLYVILPSL